MNKLASLFAACMAAAIRMIRPARQAGNEGSDVIAEWNQLLHANIPSKAGLQVTY